MHVNGGFKNNRLKDYDYHNRWFFVTNKTDFFSNYLLDNIRDLVKNELISLAKKTKGVGIDYFHIMPNHIHVILIFENSEFPLSEFGEDLKLLQH